MCSCSKGAYKITGSPILHTNVIGKSVSSLLARYKLYLGPVELKGSTVTK